MVYQVFGSILYMYKHWVVIESVFSTMGHGGKHKHCYTLNASMGHCLIYVTSLVLSVYLDIQQINMNGFFFPAKMNFTIKWSKSLKQHICNYS
jgi:hypothetical protein